MCKKRWKKIFVGAYLQGSFAIGDFSEYSDCDFIVVTDTDLASHQLAELQQLHKVIQELPYTYWHLNLEGSYVPKHILRRWSLEPRDPPGESRDDTWGDPGMSGVSARCYPFWYINHGANSLVRSEHDNSQVVRWTLRERGVCLRGPDIKTLIEPVAALDLKGEVRETMDIAFASGLAMPTFAMQAFWVGLFSRILHTIETGGISSKKVSMQWAQQTLADDWQDLIAHSLTLRKGDVEQSSMEVDAELINKTRAFCHYCVAQADKMMKRDGV